MNHSSNLHRTSYDVPRSLVPAGVLSAIRRRLFRALEQLRAGALVIVDGDASTTFGDARTGPTAKIVVHDASAYWSVVTGGSIGAATAYMRGEWDSDDLVALSSIMCANQDVLGSIEGGTAVAAQWWNRLRALASPNTRSGSQRNIAHHYDVSNEFFALFLDESMTYSCAVFPREDASLEEAQLEKIRRTCGRLELAPGDRLLEIGTGWGALSMLAAREYGARVTTSTISRKQWELARARASDAGLLGDIDFLLRDYRDLGGSYDKIVSIEMIEAIGHAQLETFFEKCSELLRPGGRLLVQAITIRDQDEAAHRRSVDFIKRYVYPGSSIPSVTTLVSAATQASDLTLHGLEDMTPHYARTLLEWRTRLLRNVAEAKRLGFDEQTVRMWEYYLAYCEGGFRARYLRSTSLLFTKPGPAL